MISSDTDTAPITMIDPGRQMLSIEQVATQLGVSIGCVYNLVQQNKLPAHRIGIRRGAIRVKQSAVDEFLNSTCTVKSVNPVEKIVSHRLETARPRKIGQRPGAKKKAKVG